MEARRPQDQTIARSSADVASAEPAAVELNLAPASVFAGFVHDAGGAPASAAQVDCFFLGIVLAYVFQMTRSLYASALVHGVINGVSVIVFLAGR